MNDIRTTQRPKDLTILHRGQAYIMTPVWSKQDDGYVIHGWRIYRSVGFLRTGCMEDNDETLLYQGLASESIAQFLETGIEPCARRSAANSNQPVMG